ncbi:MAG: hypothetical protein KZQ93_08310 [Candidatus Thiodiazotropha sp. (ex Monitilora ramsayi)]|nr:hypothetical protein [Candidatus Thiodiazotropha sp. (ex Monitilora ramsayi)]
MSNPCHGVTGTDVDDAIQIPRSFLSPSGRYGFALLFSVCFHIMILWLVAQYLLKTDDYAAPPQPKTIHLQLSPIEERQTEPAAKQHPVTPGIRDSLETPNRNSEPPITDTPSTVRSSPLATEKPPINSARILATARDLAHEMAADDKTQTKRTDTPIQSALEKALNPKREPASVGMLADGTVRVVTEFGIVYCIRPQDDARILGPEDDLPISMTCR